MKKLFHRLRYFVADALDEWRHSFGVNLLALFTLTSALFLAGLIMLVIANLDRRVQGLRQEIRIDVYLQDGHLEQERTDLVDQLDARTDVSRVEYVDKDEALRRYRGFAADLAELANELQDNPLPASLEIYLAPGSGEVFRTAEAIASRLKGAPGVDEVRFNQDLQRLESFVGMARIGGAALAAVVLVAVVFVMASVLRLAVYARREEIDIMLLVGATPSFIRGPFLVGGLVQGLIAAAAALALLEGARRATLAYAGSQELADLVAARPLTPDLSGLLVLVGLTVSLVGSWFAVRQPAA